ncbi:MAG: bifunctional phosphopantothenoylcysteine decarboxylase/phosphopantothenate--cysteine ligase CoaBC [Halarsenatibacteraceae bacterium]
MRPNIILGITGGIAAYKMAHVASSLTKDDYNVDVIMTESAKEFISPLTFQSLTHNSVESEMFTPPANRDVKHIALADRADLLLIGPATGNFIAKLASGIGDDLLSTILMATRADVMIAPAMNVNMYNNPVVQENLEILKDKGFIVLEPDTGYLACGYEGGGRLPEPDVLVAAVKNMLTPKDLSAQKLLVTAGPTQEMIDPVRFLSNRSTGKMGYAIAERARNRGAEVVLISGPTDLNPPEGVQLINVQSAQEMAEAAIDYFPEVHAGIMAAAVSDYRPAKKAEQKLKKSERTEKLTIELSRTPDIISELNKIKGSQKLVGFAAESENLKGNAERKLEEKGLDLIVANNIADQEVGFASNNNRVLILNDQFEYQVSIRDKKEVADIILDELKSIL